jgi:hypothetical protein
LRIVIAKLSEFEFDLAKQSALSDRSETLKAQQLEFNEYIKTVNKSLPSINDVLTRTKDFCSNEVNRDLKLREEIVNYYSETSTKLDMVIK